MTIREDGGLDAGASRFNAASAEEIMRELEGMLARGEISRLSYFEKKRTLVGLYLKATTTPRRRFYDEYDGPD